MSKPPTPWAELIETRFTRTEGCWEWTGVINPRGYGILGRKRTERKMAHVAVYEVLVGSIPANRELHHTCENKGCVNPDHLVPLTRSEHLYAHSNERTHCNHGHEFAVVGFYYRKSGTKECRECCKIRSRSYRKVS